MSRRLLRIVAVVVACHEAPVFATSADEHALVCPDRWPEGVVVAPEPFLGWKVALALPAPLVGIAVFRGAPEELGQIMPTSQSRTTTEDVAKYRFNGAPDDPEVWIQCMYGAGFLTLSRRVAGHPQLCATHMRMDQDGLVDTGETRCR